jgi:DNA repair protein RadC
MLDCAKLAESIHAFTGIPKKRLIDFIAENTAEELSPSIAFVCATDSQRKKLTALIEFSRLFATVKSAKKSRKYRLDDPAAASGYFKAYFADTRDRERVVAAFMDPQARIIKTKTISVGSIDSALVPHGEIAKEALFCSASGVMLAHNHPGGSTMPSPSDIEATRRVLDALKLLNIRLYDHIIVADDKTASMTALGYIYSD